jgi:hypothetical protein
MARRREVHLLNTANFLLYTEPFTAKLTTLYEQLNSRFLTQVQAAFNALDADRLQEDVDRLLEQAPIIRRDDPLVHLDSANSDHGSVYQDAQGSEGDKTEEATDAETYEDYSVDM